MVELLLAEDLVRERMAEHEREVAHARLLQEAARARRARRGRPGGAA